MRENRQPFGPLLWSVIAMLPAIQPAHTAVAAEVAPAADTGDTSSAGSVSPSSLQEITVTAERRSENIQNVPISIVALSSSTLTNLGAKSLHDLGGIAPSLTFGKTNNQGEVGIRGITDYSRDAGIGSRAGVYIDGVYLGSSWMDNVPLIDIDHVEVLNGPQGTLFGMNTDAGAISIVTRQPSAQPSAEAIINVGNFGYHDESAYLTGPISSGHGVTASLSVSKSDSAGYMYNTYYQKRMDGIDHSSARVKLRYSGESLDIEQSADWMRQRDPTVFYVEQAAPGTDPYTYTSPYNDFQNTEMYGTTSTITYRLANGFKVVNIADLRRGSRETTLNGEGNTVPGIPLATVIGDYPEWERQASEELRLVSPTFKRFDFVTGLYYFHMRDHEDFRLTLGPGFSALGPPLSLYANYPIEAIATTHINSYAAYANANYRLGAGLELTAGVRYSIDHKSLDYSMLDQYQILLGYAPDITDAQTFHNLSPKVGLNYHLTRNVMLYASYAEGYKSGGWAADFDTNAQIQAGLRVNPETARDYEAGLKSTFLSNRVRLNLAVFEEKFSNFQVFEARERLAGGQEVQETSLTNSGKVTTKGVELELATKPIPELTLTTNVSYDDSHFDRYPGGGGISATGQILDANGAQTPYAPAWRGFAAADLNLPAGSSHQFLLHLDYNVQSKSYSYATYVNPISGWEFDIPAYGVLNGRIGLSSGSGSWEVDLWCKNLADTNKWYYGEQPTIGQYRLVDYLPPRSYGVTLTARF